MVLAPATKTMSDVPTSCCDVVDDWLIFNISGCFSGEFVITICKFYECY